MNLLEEWDASYPLTEEELKLINKSMKHEPGEPSHWDNIPLYTDDQKTKDNLVQQYFDLMPGCNISYKTHKMLFNNCCSDFIRELFKIHVDDETLVISSDCEHPTVKECLANCKNTLILNQHQDIRKFNLNKIQEAIKNYNKIFVYIISVRNDTGEIVPQAPQQRFVLKGKQHRLAAGRDLFLLGHLGVQARDRIALGLIIGPELRRVFSNLLRIVFRLCTDIGQRRRLFRLQLAVGCQFLQPVRIRHIVNIPEVFPLPVLVNDFLVIAQLCVDRVRGKNQLPVQAGIDQHHYDGHHDNHRDQRVQNSAEQVFCHPLSLSFPKNGSPEKSPR